LKPALPLILLTLAAVCAASAEEAARPQIAAFVVEGLPAGLTAPSGAVPKAPLPYSADAIQRSARALSKFLSENGYPYNRITTSIDAGDSLALAVRFAADPDERVCNGPPVVSGVSGNAAMYLRDARVVPGGIFNSADVDESVRRLSARPYVRSVRAESPVIVEDAPPCGDSLRVAVVPFAVVEKRGMEVEGALGYESGRDGKKGALSGRLDLSLINMLRKGESAEVSYAGTTVGQRFRLSAQRPWLFGLPLSAGGSAGLEVEDGGYGYFSGDLWAAAEARGRWRCGAAVKGSETVPPDTLGSPYRFYGADVFIALIRTPWERGRTAWEFEVRTGSGVANREKSYSRASMDASAGVHLPLFARYAAAAGRVRASSLFTDEDYLPPAELFRVGGHGSLRGYSEEEFAFRSALYSQGEILFYFNKTGSVFAFIDGGAGFDSPEKLSLDDARWMLGYGVGVRFPSRLGTVSLEWARNVDDGWSLGRVHVGVRAEM